MSLSTPLRRALALTLALWAFACADSSDPLGAEPLLDAAAADGGDAGASGPGRAYFVLPDQAETFGELPWPNDLARLETSDGSLGNLDLSTLREATRGDTVRDYLDGLSEVEGWSPSTAVYFRFGRAVEAGSVPASAAASLTSEASVFLADIDPESPTHGARVPVEVFLQSEATRYWEGPTLAAVPVPGARLRPGGRYLAVLTRAVVPASGDVFTRDEDLERLLAGEDQGRYARAAARYGDLGAELASLGIDPSEVLNLAVFTVGDPAAYFQARVDALATQPTPSAPLESWSSHSTGSGFRVASASVSLPLFQEGEYPYAQRGGAIPLEDGELVVADQQDADVLVSVPTSEMPAEGYPLVIYGHGTGGSARSAISGGAARALAAEGIATLGFDQAFHGSREVDGDLTEVLTFNVANPDAFRHNALQAALEILLFERLAHELRIPGAAVEQPVEVHFDSNRIFYMGHSQGVLSGAPALGTSEVFPAAVLSGGAGQVSLAVLHKTEPLDIPAVAGLLLSIDVNDEDEGFHLAHPMLVAMQTFVDASDGVTFGPGLTAGRSLFYVQGLSDPYAPYVASDALALSAGLALTGPALDISEARGLLGLDALLARPEAGSAVSSLNGSSLTQGVYQAAGGHFVAFDSPILESWASFLADASRGELPSIR